MPLADDQGGAQQGEADELEGVAWSGKSVGGGRLMQLAGRVAKAIGPAGVEGLAHAISPLVVTGGGDLRTICCEYARRIFPKASHSSHLAFMRQHLSHFASILADRALALRGGDDDFLLVGRNIEHCVKAVRADEGCILISAHVGNWELGGRMLRDLGGPPVSLVKVEAEDPREREAVAQALYGNGRRPSIIDPRDGLRASLAIRAALEAGETVCMLGDRVYGAQESIQVPFLGSMARFRRGPGRWPR
jgi:lauroyl/myristoyl acyltransferase